MRTPFDRRGVARPGLGQEGEREGIRLLDLVEDLERLHHLGALLLVRFGDPVARERLRDRLAGFARHVESRDLELFVADVLAVRPTDEVPAEDVVDVAVPVVVDAVPGRLARIPPEIVAQVDVRGVDATVDHGHHHGPGGRASGEELFVGTRRAHTGHAIGGEVHELPRVRRRRGQRRVCGLGGRDGRLRHRRSARGRVTRNGGSIVGPGAGGGRLGRRRGDGFRGRSARAPREQEDEERESGASGHGALEAGGWRGHGTRRCKVHARGLECPRTRAGRTMAVREPLRPSLPWRGPIPTPTESRRRPMTPLSSRPLALAACLGLAAAGACTGAGSEAPDPAAEGLPTELEARIAARLDGLDAISTLYAKHLPSGRELAVRADRPMNTLSVIKIPVMVQAFLDARDGRLDLDERVVVGPGELRRGSGLVQTFAPGLSPTWRDLVRQMIITSDNTATDMVIGAVGLDRVNALLADAGYRETRLRMTTGDLFREVWMRADPANASMTHREVFERGFPSDPEASARSFAFEGDSTVWLGRSTAREMGRMMEQLVHAELADAESSAEMLDMLRGQFYTSRLPQRVRWQGVGVAHKTGDWPPIAGNDVGVLFYEGGPTVVAVFTNQNRGHFFELEATLGLIAEDIVTAWR